MAKIGYNFRSILKTIDILPENNHFFMLINYSSLVGFLGHAAFIFIFGWLGIMPLALFNIISSLIYLSIFLLNRRGYHLLAQVLGSLEIITHAILAVVLIGWDSGFHYYLLGIVPIALLSPLRNKLIKLLIAGLFCIIYVGLNIYSIAAQPFLQLDTASIQGLNNMNMVGIFTIFALLASHYHTTVSNAERELRQVNLKLELLASLDPLSKLLNRRAIMDRIKNEAKRFERSRKTFVLVISDIDDFKFFNDQYGHDCGDDILVKVADSLKKSLREQDQIARWGGEEFLILLPETDLERGLMITERIRLQIEQQIFDYHENKISITMTFGLALYDGNESVANCIIKADRALRDGKMKGKNCIREYQQ